MAEALQSVEIHLDKTRHLRFDFRAIRKLEKQTSKPLLRGELLKLAFLDDILVFLAAGLEHEDPTVTADSIAPHLDLANLTTYIEAIGAALALALPKPKRPDLASLPLPTSLAA